MDSSLRANEGRIDLATNDGQKRLVYLLLLLNAKRSPFSSPPQAHLPMILYIIDGRRIILTGEEFDDSRGAVDAVAAAAAAASSSSAVFRGQKAVDKSKSDFGAIIHGIAVFFGAAAARVQIDAVTLLSTARRRTQRVALLPGIRVVKRAATAVVSPQLRALAVGSTDPIFATFARLPGKAGRTLAVKVSRNVDASTAVFARILLPRAFVYILFASFTLVT